MKKIIRYIILLAALGSVSCSGDAFAPSFDGGDALVVNAELVSSSDWKTRSGASLDGQSVESSDGELLITATRQEWITEQEQKAADAPLTRGTPIASVSGISNIRVNVVRTGESDWAEGSPITTAVDATKSGNGYTTSPVYSWVVDNKTKTSLFAYSPVASGSNGLSESGSNKINYTVPEVAGNQPDLCVAAPKMNIINDDGMQQIQSFALKHQLTAVGFSMLGWNLKIDKITISGVNVAGVLTMNVDGSTSWTSSTVGSRDVGVTGSSFAHNYNSSYSDITKSDGYLMMIPQVLSDAATVTINYTSTADGSDSGVTTAKLKDLSVTWGAGDKITYNIRLKTAPAVISGDLKIETYEAGYTTSSALSVFTEGSDVLTFSWDKSWLKIHHGSALSGNAGSAGAVSPWSVTASAVTSARGLYFFADSENPTALKRVATVTVKGTRSGKKTFDVVQEKAPPPLFDPANSYIVAPGGSFKFDATVQGNDGAGAMAMNPKSVQVLWQTGDGSVSLIESVSMGANGQATVQTNSAVAGGGNAVVAAYSDANGTGDILWSWHIWVTDYNPDGTKIYGLGQNSKADVPGGQVHTYGTKFMAKNPGKVIMDRNLGATAATYAPPANVAAAAKTFGFLYQWGRKDPFPGWDGVNVTSPASIKLYAANGTTLLRENSTKGYRSVSVSMAGGAGPNLSYAVKNPLHFIENYLTPYDWYTNVKTNQNNTLWGDGAQKSIYDPCPKGWRIAPSGTWSDFTRDSSTPLNGTFPYYSDATVGEYYGPGNYKATNGRLYEAGSVKAWYPAPGRRDYTDGTMWDVGNYGYYWSSSVSEIYGLYLGFSVGWLHLSHTFGHATGFPVRCVQDK